ncbi:MULTISPECIES: hypothetical protein [unclassified Novosphingobium]|uniref:hypothetical protein n=1 Tax=unclassified Novosphingobium TaxID=2644732 RepID=UPI0014942DA3|nr:MULTISPECIES: hypothetical protein [unclassified Novosphingobium]MBB3357020.1 hypothetical protein [Novosphingobium sp. BK256]MBB3373421.1 hypothetical protein [Novosphingobium sp. BK280]MBB3377790.1 hypothetical protein [Novosphingobium sp. BK258]MBB3418799.1 hypothetical protein [Novosphingobium sp. BK267]MBB3450366.1 hypothetical protein [Novosphingobium sp. BK352]
MARARRSFKLRLSPAGLDVLIDSHCHLIRVTRSLIAWGTTLHVAVEHLSTLSTGEIIEQMKLHQLDSLGGAEEHHVGASNRLWDIATSITERVQETSPDGRQPNLGTIYLLALIRVPKADKSDLMSAFVRALQSGARSPASTEVNDLAG